MLNKAILIVWIVSLIIKIITNAASLEIPDAKIILVVVFLAATGLYTVLFFLEEFPGKLKKQKQSPTN